MEIDLIGVPLDFGAGRRGVDMGPSAIRYAGLRQGLERLGYVVNDRGNIAVPLLETCEEGNPKLKYLDPIVRVAARVADCVAQSLRSNRLPLVLGGDHSVALGSVIGAARERKLGMVWLDAHGDFNTEDTTPSGNIHGMPLAAICGYGADALVTLGGAVPGGYKVAPENVVIIGVRDLDATEKVLLRESRVSVYSMEAVDRLGMNEVMSRALEIAGRGVDGLYLSFDLDGIDPNYAPGVGTPVSGGLTYREAHVALERIAETGRLVGMDVVEVNPILDRVNITAELAVELTLSAFGKRIWEV